MTDEDIEATLSEVRRRMQDPQFRAEVMDILERFGSQTVEEQHVTSGLDYLDSTLKSPRLRAILDQAKQRRNVIDAR